MDEKRQLNSHLPFVQKMLQRAKNTEYEESWQSLLKMLQNAQSLSDEKARVINETLKKLVQKLESYKNTTPSTDNAVITEPKNDNNDAENKQQSATFAAVSEPKSGNVDVENKQSAENVIATKQVELATNVTLHKHKKKNKVKKRGKIPISNELSYTMMSPRREKIPILRIKLSEILKKKRQKHEKRMRKMLMKAALLARATKNDNESLVKETENDTSPEIPKKDENLNCFVRLERLNVVEGKKYTREVQESSSSQILRTSLLGGEKRKSSEPPPMKMLKTILSTPPQLSEKPVEQSVLKSILSSTTMRSMRSKSTSNERTLPPPPPLQAAPQSVLKAILSKTPDVAPPLPPLLKFTARKSTGAISVKKPNAMPPAMIKIRRNSLPMRALPPRTRSAHVFKVPQPPPEIKEEKFLLHVIQVTDETGASPPMTAIPSELIPPDTPPPVQDKEILLSAEFTKKKIRPWLQNSEHRKMLKNCEEMLSNGNCLAATFKCMGSTCSYFTNDPIIFRRHLELHIEHLADDSENFQKCCYCNYDNVGDLVDHIIDAHGSSRYQCPYCFYRSCDTHVFTHLKYYHGSKSEMTIECRPIKSINEGDLKAIWKNYSHICRAITCVVCKSKFYNIANFTTHVLLHKIVPSFQCVKCKEKVARDFIIYHLKKCHGFGDFCCAFCSFSTDSIEMLRKHLTNNHPNNLMFYFDGSIKCNHENTLFMQANSKEEIFKVLTLKKLGNFVNKRGNNIKVFNNKIALDNAANVAKGFQITVKVEPKF